MQALGRSLIALGVLLVGVGAFLYFGLSVPWLGRLPGDIRIERPGMHLYFPITTCLLLSAVLSGLMYLWSRLR